VYGGGDAGAFEEEADGADVAAGVLAVTGACGDADEAGVAPPLAADVAVSALAATAADFALGAAAVPLVAVVHDGVLALLGMAVAYALDGIEVSEMLVPQPSAHTTCSTVRRSLRRVV
jgi:hypothetical protein